MTVARWSGPALVVAGVGILIILILRDPADRGVIAGWIVSDAAAPARLLPLIGLAAASALVPASFALAGLAVFSAGVLLGSLELALLLATLGALPGAESHLFFTFPISSVAAGLVLLAPSAIRQWLLPLAALIAGAVLAVATKITDPTLHDPAIFVTGVVVAVWTLVAVGLTVRGFRRPWFSIPARILGSWLVAIGVLFGGAALLARPPLPELPPAQPTEALPVPPPEDAFPDLAPPRRDPLDLGADGLREP
ncbi:hypothetical protein [Amorphus sp. 3PC139-8]|uniref:hypothetical protein n=1 Tax=Amorphus sp. 3PC139-8 TaxID=2735676 RepID=UPI00345D5D4F